MKRILGYSKNYLPWLAIIILSSFGCSITNVYIVDLLKRVIDLSISKKTDFSWLMIVALAAAAILVGMLSNFLVTKMTGAFGATVLRDLRRDMVEHISQVSPAEMGKQNFGEIMERLSSDVSVVAGYMETYFKDCLYAPILIVVFAVYLFGMSPLLTVLCLGPLLIMVPASIKLLRPVKLAQSAYVKKLGLTNNYIQEACDGADVIKSYNLQDRMSERYFNALLETLDISNKNDLRQYNIEPLSALIREAPTAIALCAGGYLALKGSLTIGILIAFISGIKKINEPLVYAYQLVVRTQMAMISANRVLEVLDIPTECNTENAPQLERRSGTAFEFKDVTFAYANSKPVLEHFNLSVKEGQKIAIVGKSGCGKSTLIKLLCRQISSDDGEIYFFGNRFSDINPNIIRSQIALVSQEPLIFPMSVLDNIRIGRPDAGREEIIDAAKKADCDEFIEKMPGGYDTMLTEKGDNLSGGQRQRIAIARAILKDAPIILMDEPTSALDTETEKHVNETLLKISENKTLITVAHRLNTVADYDEIIRLEHSCNSEITPIE